MTTAAEPRAYRILRRLERFRTDEDSNFEKARWGRPLLQMPGERIIGVYVNDDDDVVVTTHGVYLRDGASVCAVAYPQIREVILPGDKSAIDGLVLKLTDESSVPVPIVGGRGRFRDRYEFARFLMRVMDDAPSGTAKT